MATKTVTGIRLSALCPKFLHTNSTSHTWPFSAIAELIDNAYDPDVNAKQIWIDKTVINDNVCLTFTDNGNGMTSEKLHKMLSFGFSDKVAVNGRVPVGLYGNGFKSGSMRLGKDAIVFTKNGESMCVGLLSQTYLEAIKAEHVMVPIVSFDRQRQMINPGESRGNLKALLTHSLFSSEDKLLAELDAILGKKGTRIIIWNLRRDKNGKTEFDFDKDKYDIRIPEDLDEATGKRGYKKQERMDQNVPESDYSLRAYCSILYLKPRMQIIVRGQKVQTQLVSKSLAYIERDIYRPKFLAAKTVRITFGFNCRNKDHYGIMMYHRNRLIKAYERVGCQLKANNMGVGVVGIIECNFLKPTHNKQDFDYTNEYRLTIAALGEKLNDYWNEMKAKKNEEYPLDLLVEDIQKRPDQTWVQCDSCLKWRKLADGIDRLPEKWYCSLNPDPQFRDCSVPEEPEDDDLIHPTYEKTYKKRDKEKFRKRMEYSQQMANEMYLKTFPVSTSKDFKTLSSVSGKEIPISRLTESSNTSVTRSLNTSNNRLVSSPHPDSDSSLKRRASGCLTPITAKTPRLHNQVIDNHAEDDDEDVIILEESSTPKPAVDSDIVIIKTEHISEDQGSIPKESCEVKEPCGTVTSETKCGHWTAATQTEIPNLVVKKEEVEDSPGNLLSVSEMDRLGPNLQETANVSETSSADLEIKVNELRNQLQLTNEEKETYWKQCEMLARQVEMLEQKIVEMNDKYVKKEMCHQSTETNTTFPEHFQEHSPEGIAILYQQALKEIENLKEQCNTLQNLKTECSKCTNGDSKSEVDEIAVQLDDVFRQLDKCSIERDQYKNEIELLSMEKTQIAFQCEELKTEIAQLKATIPQAVAQAGDSTTSNVEDQVNYSDEESLKLRSLRVNVGHLLATIMPDLDLKEVNYDVDVVDEILGQVVEQMHEISST
ncbi:PREDICTED: MORC family CW-type zinc finger protein 3 isoform X1 [Crocodylus porosus]|uniref:MORC family CW-type zinc finger 3 n=1 Tax=Crocodylus porosus TaxID=8502 RepID=A0A7M4FGD8_CROPO|nr:PREDICTED: MORC family CW-type zinc finger protein 3 isoform X1 [Crocodylus porosus]